MNHEIVPKALDLALAGRFSVVSLPVYHAPNANTVHARAHKTRNRSARAVRTAEQLADAARHHHSRLRGLSLTPRSPFDSPPPITRDVLMSEEEARPVVGRPTPAAARFRTRDSMISSRVPHDETAEDDTKKISKRSHLTVQLYKGPPLWICFIPRRSPISAPPARSLTPDYILRGQAGAARNGMPAS